jgi:hypothetical protein
VISLPQAEFWRYWDFVYPNGTNPIGVWYRQLPEDVRDTFDSLLKINRKTERPDQWIGFRRYLKGGDLQKFKVWEMEFRGADRLAHRLMGVFAGYKTAVFLVGCYHKGRNYTPRDALETACARAKLVHQQRASTIERTITTNF